MRCWLYSRWSVGECCQRRAIRSYCLGRCIFPHPSAQCDVVRDAAENAHGSRLPLVPDIHRAFWSGFVSHANRARRDVQPYGAVESPGELASSGNTTSRTRQSCCRSATGGREEAKAGQPLMTAATMLGKSGSPAANPHSGSVMRRGATRELGTNRNLFLFSRNQTVACINFVWAKISCRR
ncbi:MAG: hypothetical protein JWO71_2818 [Candidatus Acidoferrum typicum]|nr:hypothetical protein [Candidatus Acidoferrum typicum]